MGEVQAVLSTRSGLVTNTPSDIHLLTDTQVYPNNG